MRYILFSEYNKTFGKNKEGRKIKGGKVCEVMKDNRRKDPQNTSFRSPGLLETV